MIVTGNKNGRVISPWSFIAGTGSYTAEAWDIAQGELVTNGGFDTDISVWGYVYCDLNWNVEGYLEFVQNYGSDRYMVVFQNDVFNLYKKYRVSFKAKSADVTCKLTMWPGFYNSLSIIEQPDLTCTWQTYTFEFVSLNDVLRIKTDANVSDGDQIDIDNISVTEIPPLPNFQSGTKLLKCTSAGTCYVPSKWSHGEIEIEVFKGGDGNNPFFHIIQNDISVDDGYNIVIDNSEILAVQRRTNGTPTNLFVPAQTR